MSAEHRQSLRDMLPWYVNGTLTTAETAEVAAHLLTCRECQAEVAQWRQLAHAMSAPHVAADSPAARHATRAAIHRALVAHSTPAKGFSPMPETPMTPPRRQPPIARRSVFPVASILFAALTIYSAVLFTRLHNISSHGGSPGAAATAVAPPNIYNIPDIPVPLNAAATDQGVRITVAAITATTTQTKLYVGIFPDKKTDHSGYRIQSGEILTDANGSSIGSVGHSVSFTGANCGVTSQKPGPYSPPWACILTAGPLPLAELQHPDLLRFTVTDLIGSDGNQDTNITGNWRISFMVPPPDVIARTYATLPAVTVQGITVQLQNVTIFRDNPNVGGYPRGITFLAHATNLPSNHGVFNEYAGTNYSFAYNIVPSSIEADLANGDAQQPVFVQDVSGLDQPSLVGHDDQVSFAWSAASPVTQITIPQLNFVASKFVGDPNFTTYTVKGPWSFTIPTN